MSGKSSKKKTGKNKANKNKSQSNKNIRNKLEKQRDLNEWLEQKHITSQIRIRNFTDTTWDVVKAAWAIILGLATVGIVVFLIWAGIAYINGESKLANVTMTIMQALTGVVSVVVGIWALYLTIKATRKENTNKERLNIVVSPTSAKIIRVSKEKDVNPDSIG